MKNQSGTIKTNLELDRVVMGVQVVTGDSQEEVMIFRYTHTLHHNIYIIITTTHLNADRTGPRVREGEKNIATNISDHAQLAKH